LIIMPVKLQPSVVKKAGQKIIAAGKANCLVGTIF
jgi:hypothetical protein